VVLADLDFFEVASSLCKFLLARQRVNDSLFFLTILTTPLKTLQRRGFDTTRILKARDAERARVDQQQRDAEVQQQIEAVSRQQAASGLEKQLKEMFPNVAPEALRSVVNNMKQPSLEGAVQEVLEHQAPPRSPTPEQAPPQPMVPSNAGFLNNWKRKLGYKGALTQENEQAPLLPESRQPNLSSPEPSMPGATQRRPTPQALVPNATSSATPQDDIKRNVLQAIQASKPDQASSIMSQSQVRQVKESEDAYCDSSAVGLLALLRGEINACCSGY
jgi:hypothetical protein